MGKTPKPLWILAVEPLDEWGEIAALEAQGHTVVRAKAEQFCGFTLTEFDLVLGPTCWLMDEQHRKYLDLAIAGARRRRYPPTKKESA